MSNCIWVKQYMRQGMVVREHQRCYNRPLSKADKGLYEEVTRREQQKWDEWTKAQRQVKNYPPLEEEGKTRQKSQAEKKADKKFDEWREQRRKLENLREELGIEEDARKTQIITPPRPKPTKKRRKP